MASQKQDEIPAKTIRIGPFDYSVKHLDKEESARSYGTHNSELLEICLRQNFSSPAQAAETMLHEIFHAIWNCMQLREKDGEERIVGALALGMAMAIRDNPALVRWMVASLK